MSRCRACGASDVDGDVCDTFCAERLEAEKEGRTVPCECGCGTILPPKNKRHEPSRFVRGHYKWKAGVTSIHTGYERAKRVVPEVSPCELLRIGGCGGPVDRAHLDQNPLNNERENIKSLCRTHHKLVDSHRIDFHNPVMPPYYVDKRGNRRYPQRTLHEATCEWCGATFSRPGKGRRFCSLSCSTAEVRAHGPRDGRTFEQRSEHSRRVATQMHADGRLGRRRAAQ